jgi:hypothetical protein
MAKDTHIAAQTVKIDKTYYAPGQTLPALADDEARRLRDRGVIVAVGSAAASASDDDAAPPHTLSVEKLKEHLQTVTEDTVLEELHNAERDHKNRATALEAIEARMVELDGTDEDEDPDHEEQ